MATDRSRTQPVSRRRFLGLTAGLSVAAMGRASTARAQAQKATIRYQDWHFAEKEWGAFKRKMIDDFKKANPNVEIVMDAVPYGETLNKFVAQTKAGQPADVVYALDAHAVQYLEAGYILDASRYMKPNTDFSADKFNDAGIKAVTRGEKVFALPFAMDLCLLHYNMEMFKKAGLDPNNTPKTWAEFQEAAIKLTRKDATGRTVQWGYAPLGKKVLGAMYRMINWFWENEADILTPDNKAAALNSPGAVEAFTFLVELGTKHKVFPPQVTDLDPGAARSLFAKEQVAMLSGYLGGREICLAENPALKDKQAFAPIPRGKKKAGSLSIEYYAVSSQTKNPEVAFNFVKHMMTKDVQVQMWKAVEKIPGRKDALTDPSIQNDKFASLAVSELAYARPTPLIPQWPQVVDITLDAFQRALLGQVQPKPALDNAAKQIDAILKR
jgi:ABC-type glycerol-3-phosphate transport system substrate-binding protein